uniref:RING-type domain-containing protein n=1 Tax=Megaviridae environmental sample TaxID=1737588 RepID=A0A5J6VJ49_9VIRU|nr:MAG: hypothetical protein [Megaviridae environmental sample]
MDFITSVLHLFVSESTNLPHCDNCQRLKLACNCIHYTLISTSDTCCICRETQTQFCKLQCNHMVCKDCFSKFRQHKVSKCPLCRQKLKVNHV